MKKTDSKSHEGSLHGGNKTKRVKGTVDRVTGGIVVILVRNDDDPEIFNEIYVPVEKFRTRIPQEGDQVSVLID